MVVSCFRLDFVLHSDDHSESHLQRNGLYLLRTSTLDLLCTADNFGDSPIKSNMKLGPQTHIGAESQSEGTIQLVPKP